jgi:2-iminobutanoate/2-iminopropanoate deaminase
MKRGIKKYTYYLKNVKHAYSHVELGKTLASRSVVLGNLVFLSGATGIDVEKSQPITEDLEKQVFQVLENIRTALEEAGSSIENLVKYYIFIRNASDSSRLWKAMYEYFRERVSYLVEEPPAVTVCGVIGFEQPGCLVEIDAIAVVMRNMPGWEMKKYPMCYKKTRRTYTDIQPGKPFFSESVAVGNLLFISGMTAENPNTGEIESNRFEDQMDIAFDKIRTAMDNAGTSPSNIIKSLHFLTGVEDLLVRSRDLRQSFSPASDRLWKRELEHYDRYAPVLFDTPPASTFLKVPSLGASGALVQLDITAVMSRYQTEWEVRNYLLYLGSRGFPRHIGEIKKYYSNSVVVGNLAFVSGQTPTNSFTARIDSDSFRDQVKVALTNLKSAIEETGSSLDNLIKTNVLIPQPENLPVFRKIELDFYQKYAPALIDEPPATTVIHPLSLAGTKLYVEIEAIAYVPNPNVGDKS